jgi:hypothetical protein
MAHAGAILATRAVIPRKENTTVVNKIISRPAKNLLRRKNIRPRRKMLRHLPGIGRQWTIVNKDVVDIECYLFIISKCNKRDNSDHFSNFSSCI